jgi:hypothetical protein
MGARIEHAITSIQYFVPSVVHIITSTDYKSQHSRRLKTWAEKYGFRKGDVHAVEDLFKATSVDSILSLFCKIADVENICESEVRWHVGITGGTMHMAATGVYASLLLGIFPFYVIRPPEGQKPMPNRDVLEFPSFSGLSCLMGIPTNDLAYLAEGKGKMQDLFERMPEYIRALHAIGLVKVEDDEWVMTPEGQHTLDFIGNSKSVQELLARQAAAVDAREQDANDVVGQYIW